MPYNIYSELPITLTEGDFSAEKSKNENEGGNIEVSQTIEKMVKKGGEIKGINIILNFCGIKNRGIFLCPYTSRQGLSLQSSNVRTKKKVLIIGLLGAILCSKEWCIFLKSLYDTVL